VQTIVDALCSIGDYAVVQGVVCVPPNWLHMLNLIADIAYVYTQSANAP